MPTTRIPVGVNENFFQSVDAELPDDWSYSTVGSILTSFFSHEDEWVGTSVHPQRW